LPSTALKSDISQPPNLQRLDHAAPKQQLRGQALPTADVLRSKQLLALNRLPFLVQYLVVQMTIRG
jgi:hypothetical protein